MEFLGQLQAQSLSSYHVGHQVSSSQAPRDPGGSTPQAFMGTYTHMHMHTDTGR